ncbi:hypothetical protein, partial [Pseudomonas syringae]|uniref:hypothetical protein n=1 Tax=Pseudomonas syringae TaxID=317 RepID=UPI001E2ACC10
SITFYWHYLLCTDISAVAIRTCLDYQRQKIDVIKTGSSSFLSRTANEMPSLIKIYKPLISTGWVGLEPLFRFDEMTVSKVTELAGDMSNISMTSIIKVGSAYFYER